MIVWSWPKNSNFGKLWKSPQGFLHGAPNGPWRATRAVWGLVELTLAVACLHVPRQAFTPGQTGRWPLHGSCRVSWRLPLVLDKGIMARVLDGSLNGPWTPTRAVEGPVQVTHCPKISGFAFSHFVSYPEVRGITISPPWDHSSSNDTWLGRTWLKRGLSC